MALLAGSRWLEAAVAAVAAWQGIACAAVSGLLALQPLQRLMLTAGYCFVLCTAAAPSPAT